MSKQKNKAGQKITCKNCSNVFATIVEREGRLKVECLTCCSIYYLKEQHIKTVVAVATLLIIGNILPRPATVGEFVRTRASFNYPKKENTTTTTKLQTLHLNKTSVIKL